MKGEFYRLRDNDPQDVKDLSDLVVQVAAEGGPLGGGPQSLEGSVDGVTFVEVLSLTTTTGIADVPVKKLTTVRLGSATPLTNARVTVGGFDVRGDS